MELILGIGLLALFSKRIIKTITNIIAFLGISVISVVMAFIYKLPYSISLAVCIVVSYGIIEFIKAVKNLIKSLVTFKNKYTHGYIQKFVDILINCNYLVFMFLCYYFSINEMINPTLTSTKVESICLSIMIVIGTKILRKVLEKCIVSI